MSLAMSIAERLRTGGATSILGDWHSALWRKIDDIHGERVVDGLTPRVELQANQVDHDRRPRNPKLA
jgi:hypothetical protein